MIHSFLLIGQSNMAGRGFFDEAHHIDTTNIKISRNGLWVPMFRPINPDRSFSGVNLAESFAESYAKKYGTEVGLICCADGGTSLEQWMPGTVLYDNAVNNARLAMRSSKLMGVLWHQGEADMREALYSTYKKRFEIMMASLRKDLGLEDVPFMLGGLGDFLSECELGDPDVFKNFVRVNRELEAIAKDNAMTAFVPATGLGSNPDKLHFNADALYEFGLRYFEKYVSLADQKTIDSLGCDAENNDRSAIELL